jgi:hypothetical protein
MRLEFAVLHSNTKSDISVLDLRRLGTTAIKYDQSFYIRAPNNLVLGTMELSEDARGRVACLVKKAPIGTRASEFQLWSFTDGLLRNRANFVLVANVEIPNQRLLEMHFPTRALVGVSVSSVSFLRFSLFLFLFSSTAPSSLCLPRSSPSDEPTHMCTSS